MEPIDLKSELILTHDIGIRLRKKPVNVYQEFLATASPATSAYTIQADEEIDLHVYGAGLNTAGRVLNQISLVARNPSLSTVIMICAPDYYAAQTSIVNFHAISYRTLITVPGPASIVLNASLNLADNCWLMWSGMLYHKPVDSYP